MWIARIALPGSIYDASAAAQTFPGWDGRRFGRKEDFSEKEEMEDSEKESKNDFEHIPGFRSCYRRNKRC